MIDVYKERFEHPYLFALIPIAGVLMALAVGAHFAGADTWAGFITLYAIVLLVICSIGYVGLATLAYSTEFLRQWRIRRSDMN